MALGIGYSLPFAAIKSGGGQYKSLWNTARKGAKASGATVEDESADSSSCLVTRGADVYNDVLPTTPSLLIVPQFYKSANLYQDIPAYSADDTTMRFTVTRATTATRVNSSGLIESVASGVPRIDWLGQSCPALLVEPSATNLVLQSRDLSVSGSWTASGITAVRNAVGADGTASGATTLTATAASATITQNLSHASQSRIFGARLRRVSGTGGIQLTTNGGTNYQSVTLTSAFAPYDSGAQTVASGQVGIRMLVSGDVIEVDFTQGEVGPIATSPIPTTTGSVTRNADAITASGALVSGLIGQTEGTIYAEVDVRAFSSSLARRIVNLRVDGNNLFSLEMTTAGTQFDFVATSGGVSVGLSASGITTGIYKIAIGYNSTASGTALYVNGTLRDTKTIAIPNLSAAVFGLGVRGDGSAGSQLNDRIRAVALYTTRLTDSQLEQLTK